MKEKLIVVITKRKYPNAEFSTDDFFRNDFNFCFIDDLKRKYHYYHSDGKNYSDDKYFLRNINQSGILMIYDGYDAPDGYKINFDEMFETINNALDHKLDLYLWYHESTKGKMKEYVDKYVRKNIVATGFSSHNDKEDEVYSHILSYLKNNTSIDTILVKCFGEKSKEIESQKKIILLFEKLKCLNYKEGQLVDDVHSQDFIGQRNNIIDS